MSDEEQAVIYAAPARALAIDGERAAAREELLDLAVQRAPDPEFLRDNPPYFWRAEISSSRLDSYFTVMRDSTLKNFAQDAQAGVSFQPSHNVRVLPFGASLQGRFHNGRGENPARAEADFYTVPGLRTNEVSTDDLIRGIKAGIIRDVSVGFFGGRTICSICERDMDGSFLDWLFGDASEEEVCMHFPGEQYALKGEDGKKTGEKVLCVGRIEDARLAEVSAVYKGATPGAGVLKAQRAAEAGKLPPELARRLESRYRIALPASHRAWAGHTPQPKETVMPVDEPNVEERQEAQAVQPAAAVPPVMLTPAVREALATMGFTPASDEDADALHRAVEEVARLRAREQELTPLADEGRAYRADLIEQAIAQGKRAQGTAFPEETFRSLLEKGSLAQIKQMREVWQAVADQLVPVGARTNGTVTDDEPAPAAPTKRAVPDAAYRAR